MEFQITNDSKPTKKKEPMSHGESDAQPSAYGRRLLSQVFDKTSKSSPRRLYATISCSDPQFRLVDVTFAEMANGVNFLAHWLENLLGIGNSLQTICYIGIADLRYAIMFLAGMKCGYKVSVEPWYFQSQTG